MKVCFHLMIDFYYLNYYNFEYMYILLWNYNEHLAKIFV